MCLVAASYAILTVLEAGFLVLFCSTEKPSLSQDLLLQEATVWGWKQRRDALATARASKLRRLLHAWHSLAPSQQENAAIAAFFSAAKSIHLAQAFMAWLAAAREQAAAVSAFRGARCVSRLAIALTAWRQHVQSRASERALVQQTARRRGAATAAAVLQSWRWHAQRSREVAIIVERLRLARCKRALHAWRRAAERSMQLECASQALQQADAQIRLAQAFAAWRLLHGITCRVCALQRQHAAGMARRALRAWRAHAKRAARLRSTAACIAACVAVRLQQRALQALRESVVSRRDSEVLAAALAEERSQKLLAACQAIWHSQARAALQHAAHAEQMAAQRLICSLLSVWHQWREATRTAAAQAKAAERFAAQRESQLMAAVFDAWREETASAQHRRAAALLECLDRQAWVTQQTALAAWRKLVQHVLAARRRAEASFHAQQAEVLSDAFLSWREEQHSAAHARAAIVLEVQISCMQVHLGSLSCC